MKKFFSEFNAFISRGNVLDLAVGVIIGAAFGKIVSSLVNDIISPLIGLVLGGRSFADLKLILKEAVGEAPAVTLNYGNFIQNIIDFVIMAFVIFLIVKAFNKIKERKEKEEANKPAPAPAPSKEQLLLEDVVAELKKLNNK